MPVDPYRLPRTVVPSRYDLRLEPDLVTHSFTGEETIAVDVHEATAEVFVNTAEIALARVSAENAAGERIAGTATSDEEAERSRLAFDRPLAPGPWRLRLSFSGILNDKLRGFYRSTYKDPSGATRTIAATQFEATDARRAFPCWDEPDFKAVFAATLVIDPALTAVSNTAIVETRVEGGRKVVRFADTIRMSTYLVAFVVGELESTDARRLGPTPLRVWCVPGKRRLAAFGHEAGAFTLRFFEDYYGLAYPGDKLDLLAIPDFAAGAMENLGAITFRETALLVDEEAATHAELERVADVVAHENAHMWFGDLVTMSWWNGIWLNEAFATFMEMLAVDAWKPEWHRWTSFGVSRAAAFSVDGLWNTRPIEFPVRAPRDADAMFDVLTYEKGASVLRMLEQYLGPDVFRDGVRAYLREHAYGNADTGDLWAALGQAAGAPIPAVMDGWIFHPGFPLVSARLEGGELVLSQQRFTYLQAPPPALPWTSTPRVDAGAGSGWQVPLQLRVDGSAQRTMLGEAETRLPVAAGASVLVNAGGHGFYRVRYSGELLDRLLAQLPSGLAPIERFNLVNDTWAATVAGLVPATQYLDLAVRLRGERDRNVWTSLLASMHALNRVIRAEDRPHLERFVRELVGPAVAELGWAPAPGDDDLIRQLRGDLLRALGTLGNDATIQARAAALYAEALTDPRAVDANVLPALIGILAHVGDATRHAEFAERFRSAATPQEEQRYLYALAAFRPRPLIEQTLAKTVNGEIRTQDAPFVARAMLMSVDARELTWAFIKSQWDTMDRMYPKHGLRRMCEGVTGLATPELERDVHGFFAGRQIELGGRTLEQYLEQLRIAVTLREREGQTLASRLASAS
jgi:puromycin-sensitive aminopeptidase